MTERRYRGKKSRPIPVWNGVLEHRQRIGEAIWEFLWCLDAITKETADGIGKVYGGAPVKLKTIVADLKGDKETIRRHLQRLVDGKYIRTRRTPCGQIIEVLHSKKFGIWRKEKPQNTVSLLERNDFNEREKPQNAVSKEDSAVERQQKAAAATASTATHNPEESVWAFLQIRPCGPPTFRSLLEAGWSHRNGGSYSALIGSAVDAWEATEGQKLKHCAPFFARLSEIRKREKSSLGEPAPPRDARFFGVRRPAVAI